MNGPGLLLVRHGESTWNRLDLVQGQVGHVPLTRLGRAQSRRTLRRLRPLKPAQVWTSDQLRARQTAHHIAGPLGLEPAPDIRLRERGYGCDEGRPVSEVASLGRPDLTSEGGETFGAVVARVGSFLQEQVNGPGPVVVVTHGDTLRAALSWLGVSDDLPIENGCVIDPFGFATMAG